MLKLLAPSASTKNEDTELESESNYGCIRILKIRMIGFLQCSTRLKPATHTVAAFHVHDGFEELLPPTVATTLSRRGEAKTDVFRENICCLYDVHQPHICDTQRYCTYTMTYSTTQ
jgi:hypothetical protein